MQIELEAAENLRSVLETDGTAQELKYACLVLEDEIAALAKLPAEEMKDRPRAVAVRRRRRNGGGRRSLRADGGRQRTVSRRAVRPLGTSGGRT